MERIDRNGIVGYVVTVDILREVEHRNVLAIRKIKKTVWWYVEPFCQEKRPCAAVPVVGFHLCCRRAVSTPTPLGVHRPVAGAVLPAVNDRTEGVPHRWCTCLERASLWRYVCPLAGHLWTAFKDRTFFAVATTLSDCYFFHSYILVLEMDFLFRPL